MDGMVNEVMYKMAEVLVRKMNEKGLLTEEESVQLHELNLKTFQPELAAVYV